MSIFLIFEFLDKLWPCLFEFGGSSPTFFHHCCAYVFLILCIRKSGIKELGTYVVAVRVSGHVTFSKHVPVSLLFKLLPVSLCVL